MFSGPTAAPTCASAEAFAVMDIVAFHLCGASGGVALRSNNLSMNRALAERLGHSVFNKNYFTFSVLQILRCVLFVPQICT